MSGVSLNPTPCVSSVRFVCVNCKFPYYCEKQAEASSLGLHAGVWLISQFASCGLCWHVSLVTYIQPGGKLLTHSQESAHRGSLPTGQPGITQTHLGKYLGRFWVRKTSAIQKPGDKRCKRLAWRDFGGQGPHTWCREIQTENLCRKANKKHLKMFSGLKNTEKPSQCLDREATRLVNNLTSSTWRSRTGNETLPQGKRHKWAHLRLWRAIPQPFCCRLSSSEHWGAWERLVWEAENMVQCLLILSTSPVN